MGRPFVLEKVFVIPPTVEQILRKAFPGSRRCDKTPNPSNKLERVHGRRFASEEEEE